MARTTKYAKHEIAAEFTLFSQAAREQHDTDSYAAGYYESLIVHLLETASKTKQEAILTQLRVSTATLLK